MCRIPFRVATNRAKHARRHQRSKPRFDVPLVYIFVRAAFDCVCEFGYRKCEYILPYHSESALINTRLYRGYCRAQCQSLPRPAERRNAWSHHFDEHFGTHRQHVVDRECEGCRNTVACANDCRSPSVKEELYVGDGKLGELLATP